MNKITSCAIFPNGKIIFADQCDTNMRLVIVNNDGSLDKEIPLSILMPFDVACIDDISVALTVVNSSEIHIFDVNAMIIKNTIKTNGSCYGITYKDDKIYYGNTNSVGVVQLNNYSSSSLVNLDRSIEYFCYVASFGDCLYFSNHDTDSVSCFSLKGDKIWKLIDEDVLYAPYGVAVDKNGILYVSTANRNCIVTISPDGKKVADFLTSDDGNINPFILCFDSNRDLLLVAGYNGNCILYEIE